MRWQWRRGVLNAIDSDAPGSVWWRAVNERLLRDGCEAVALPGGHSVQPSSSAVELWPGFIAKPTARTWYRAHNASVVSAYLAHRAEAAAENAPERFVMNVAVIRVLYPHALVAAPRLALGPLARSAQSSETRGSGWRAHSSRSDGCCPIAIPSERT